LACDPADAETTHTPQPLRRSRKWLHESEKSPVRLVMARPFHSLGRLTDWLPSALALHSRVEESISEFKWGISCCLVVCLMVEKRCDKSPSRPLLCTVSQAVRSCLRSRAQRPSIHVRRFKKKFKKFVVRPRNRSDCRVSDVVHLISPIERIVAVRPRGFIGGWSWNRRAA
jgi:hypothetical protein